MNHMRNEKLTQYAKALRRKLTKEERRLWYDFLRQLPVTVNRQKVIGNFIVDFYCAQAKLAIELDGSQHYEEKRQQQDALRDETLRCLGITVLRYTNAEVNSNFQGVCSDILAHISTSSGS